MRKLAPCGTRSAYLRHLRYKEKPCKPCSDADRAYHRSRYPLIKEKENERNRIYRQNNPEKESLRRKKYTEEHLENEKERNKQYYKNHPENSAEKHRRRRAKKLNNGFEIYKTEQVIELYGTKCHICNKQIDMNASRVVGKGNWSYGLHIDHVIAIANGGPDTLENVRPSHAICNLKKQTGTMKAVGNENN